MSHIPVLTNEVLEHLNPKLGEKYIDATLGFGGHSKLIAERGAMVLGIEKDKEIFEQIKERGMQGLKAVHGSFADIKEMAEKNGFFKADGIIFDLGFSSWHIEKSGRGFSFQKEEPLDMRFNPNQGLTANEIVNSWQEQSIEKILADFGQERFSKQIARAIVSKRPIQTSLKLAQIIEQTVPFRRKIHPATKTFQALRMAVNNELEEIEKGLSGAVGTVKNGGRIAVIAFHSLEDKIVKNFFRNNKNILKIITKKPITPSMFEVRANPRARSAKLRVAEKY